MVVVVVLLVVVVVVVAVVVVVMVVVVVVVGVVVVVVAMCDICPVHPRRVILVFNLVQPFAANTAKVNARRLPYLKQVKTTPIDPHC